MRTKLTSLHAIIAGNWKMNLLRADALAAANEVARYITEHRHSQVQAVLCPVALQLQALSVLAGEGLAFGAQDCHSEKNGAYTGDVSADMVKDAGAEYVIVGHSERRANHAENNSAIQQKVSAALHAGLIPIVCIGETLEQREAGQAELVLAKQLAHSLPQESTVENTLVAYEPVWAIGTGKVATTEIIAQTHRMIAEKLPVGMHILYGGSVKPENTEEILRQPHVGGVLVGGASLKPESFCAIISAANRVVSTHEKSA